MLSFMLISPVYDLAISLVLTFWEYRPKKLSLFTRPFLAERHILVRHETNARYVTMNYVRL